MISPANRTGVVITMAGAGRRFTEAGYRVPKYEIQVRDRTLFQWSLDSLRSFIEWGCRFYFVAQSHGNVHEFIGQECRKLGVRGFEIVTVDRFTDGQATTAMLAEDVWKNPADALAIYNIDTYVTPMAMSVLDVRGDGWVPCFPGEGDKWSFAAADEHGKIIEVREKKRISPHATLGLYWFDSFRRYADAYRRYYAKPENLEMSERYVAPIYNQLIKDGANVYMSTVSANKVFPLGTPEDVRRFGQQDRDAKVSVGMA